MRSCLWAAVAALSLLGVDAPAQSVYPVRLQDTAAVYLEKGQQGAVGDGVADDSDALQRAIDRVADTRQQGIVFLAQGRYRISRTIYIWPGVRLIGYGAQRPVIALGARTNGFDQDPAYMLFFAGGRLTPGAENSRRHRPTAPFPGTVPSTVVIDANPGTFYSAISNVDLEIGDGNPGAVGVRSHYAQHCFLSHINFRLGSGLAGIDEAGNLADDLHFEGGEYGIQTGKPSPGWQFTLLDSSFAGQRRAAIREHEAGLTMVNTSIRNVPEAISIDAGYAEELWVSNSEFQNVTGPAITISNENNARTEINLRGIRCRNVPVFAMFRDSGRKLSGTGPDYAVRHMSHGLTLKSLQDIGSIETSYDAVPGQDNAAGLMGAPVLREPSLQGKFVNARDAGVVGDGTHDDTAALQAVLQANKVVYLPSGRYRITAPVELGTDSVLFGLHPSATQIVLDEESPNFYGQGGPVPMLHAPKGGTTALSGIGLYAGGTNNRASALMWQAGEHSQVNDVRFLGGHGTNGPKGERLNPYNPTHSADPDPKKRWDSQYPSLWVLNGGGGVFADIWTPDTFAQAGMMVSDTQTPGHVYELSSEHHVRNEIEVRRAAHWEFMALQTEEEWGESGHALPLAIYDSRQVLFTNFHSYRVVGSRDTLSEVALVSHSDEIAFRNAHIDSDSKVTADNGVADVGSGASERFHEFSNLDVSAAAGTAETSTGVKRVAGGFYSISGAAVDAKGRVLFIDPRMQRIYRWSPAEARLDLLRDAPISATNLVLDRAGNVMVVCYDGDGTVYSFNPDAPADELKRMEPQPAAGRPGMAAWLPNDLWNMRELRTDPQLAHKPFQYVAQDGSTFLPAGSDFVRGELYYGTKMADVLRSFTLVPTSTDKPVYVTEEEENRTWVGKVGPDGALTDLRLFADRGGEAVTTDANGDVYIAAGEVFRYSPEGKLLSTVHVPERPVSLLFGGPDHKTLFILARTSLYAWNGE